LAVNPAQVAVKEHAAVTRETLPDLERALPAPTERYSGARRASLPPTSLIICSRNRPALLGDLVESILQGEELPSEIIIVDDSDGPHPSLANRLASEGCQIRYSWTHSIGLSRANNDGIAAASHEVLVFSQDDVLVTPTWFGNIVRALLAAGPGSIVTGQVRPGEAERSDGFAPSTIADEHPKRYVGRIGVDVLFVQNMALYCSAAKAVGGFDTRLGPGTLYPAAEDNDFGFRLLEAGYQILYEPRAVTYHRPWRPSKAYAPLCWNYGCGQGGYYAKYLGLPDRPMQKRLLADLRSQGVLLASHIWRNPGQALGHVATILGLVYGAMRWQLVEHRARA
jgi:glycosyltransferase involved in cell wall biosynthesis